MPAEAATQDIAISVDGFTLFHEGTATAKSGIGDIAVAYGSGSDAEAGTGAGGFGLFDSAFASGGGQAISGDGILDSASATGAGSVATAGGSSADFSSLDSASVVGPGSLAEAGVWGPIYSGPTFTGLAGGDVATVYDPSGTLGSTALAGDGTADFASVFGDPGEADAGLGSFDFAAVFGDGLDPFHATAIQGWFLVDILPSLWPPLL